MRLPADTAIDADKLTRYLLLPQARGDKSAFLAQAGYTLENADQLLRDLRTQILPLDAVSLESNKFGQYYGNRGMLTGPNGVTLAVRTIWMTEHLSGVTKFVTLTLTSGGHDEGGTLQGCSAHVRCPGASSPSRRHRQAG